MSKSRFDLAVAYRIYPAVSKTPAVHPDDKLRLAELCLRSFRASLGGLRAKVWALLDGCPPPFEELFRRHFDDDALEFVRLDRIGNLATFLLQIRILLEQQDAERVYFAEDDYFYLPDQFPAMVEFKDRDPDIDFVTPYDHPDFYTRWMYQGPHEVRVVDGRHWRTVGGTPLTFLTTRSVLQATAPVFRSYGAGNHDASLWFALTKHRVRQPFWLLRALRRDPLGFRLVANAWRYSAREILTGRRWRLWAPTPSIATHMESCYLAPGVDWPDWFERAREHRVAPLEVHLPPIPETRGLR
jgi:hypothetical protein